MISDIINFVKTLPRCQIIPTVLRYVSRKNVIAVVSVVLRVPSLFIAETWFRTDPDSITIPLLEEQHHGGTHDFVVVALYYLAILLAVALAFLPLKKLVQLYMYIVSGFLIIAAHYCSSVYVDDEKASDHTGSVLENRVSLRRAGIHAAVQCVVSALISYLLNYGRLASLIYVLPVIARTTGYPIDSLHRVHNFAFLFQMIIVTIFFFNNVPKVLDIIKSYAHKVYFAIQLYGWMPFAMAMWFQVSLPAQFLVFWSGLLTVQLYKFLAVHEFPVRLEGWLVVMLASMAECVSTPVSLMGVCISISYLACGILTLTKLFLQGREALIEPGNIMQRGWTEGFTMFLLALQTDLIRMKSSHRAFLMSIVLFIVLSSLIQSMYEMTEPVLLGLSAGQNKNIMKHVRAVFLSTLLWILPLYMAVTICNFFDMDFWLMVVISSCILTSVQVIGSLVTYSLFMYDSIRHEPWDKLDDVVYYTKATTRVLEFIVAVFVVCYGLHESLFGEWSWVNGMILIVHCYVNVWQRLQTGWKSYLLRREAVKKVESLPDASPQQLQEHNDICAICFQELHTAKITGCSHYFHATCLKKWLYVQEKCPMCHQNVDYPTTGSNSAFTADGNDRDDQDNENEINNENIFHEAEHLAGETESSESEIEEIYDDGLENNIIDQDVHASPSNAFHDISSNDQNYQDNIQ